MNSAEYVSKETMYDYVDLAKEVMGAEQLLDALVMAMDVDELRANLEYVIQVNDLESVVYA